MKAGVLLSRLICVTDKCLESRDSQKSATIPKKQDGKNLSHSLATLFEAEK
jgi:hypothetical protein